MMKKIALIISVICLLSSCELFNGSGNRPEGVVDQDKMIKILTDVQIAQAAISYERNKGADYKSYQEPYYQYIFEKYQIDEETFKKSMSYYEDDPQNLLKIYQTVQQQLEEIKSNVQDTLVPEMN